MYAPKYVEGNSALGSPLVETSVEILEAPHWDRGRLARTERRQARCVRIGLNSENAVRAHCGRDARGPSEELE